ncbi:MAG: histidine phosphatase family protein [Pseudomonadota bacterium]
MIGQRQGRDFIVRHGETVFNAARRLQGDYVHTPLTLSGFRQADAMGGKLREILGRKPSLTLWASPTGRTLQTMAIIAEHLELDWHGVKTDGRLREIEMGSWGGRDYDELERDLGANRILSPCGALWPAPDGESYPDIVERVSAWLAETDGDPGDRLVVMHGISSRVMRALMTGEIIDDDLGVPISPDLTQGSIAVVRAGQHELLHEGTGQAPA